MATYLPEGYQTQYDMPVSFHSMPTRTKRCRPTEFWRREPLYAMRRTT